MNAYYLTDSEQKVRYGRAMSSRMPAVYVHLSSQDLDDASQEEGKNLFDIAWKLKGTVL